MPRKGHPRLRTTLFFAVMHLVQVDDAFAREYLRFQQRAKNPLTKVQALGAAGGSPSQGTLQQP